MADCSIREYWFDGYWIATANCSVREYWSDGHWITTQKLSKYVCRVHLIT